MGIEVVFVVCGAFLLLTAIVGGGFEIQQLRVPRVGTFVRVFLPGEAVVAVGDGGLHQRVPGGVELDHVDAVTEPVVREQTRVVAVGLETPSVVLR